MAQLINVSAGLSLKSNWCYFHVNFDNLHDTIIYGLL